MLTPGDWEPSTWDPTPVSSPPVPPQPRLLSQCASRKSAGEWLGLEGTPDHWRTGLTGGARGSGGWLSPGCGYSCPRWSPSTRSPLAGPWLPVPGARGPGDCHERLRTAPWLGFPPLSAPPAPPLSSSSLPSPPLSPPCSLSVSSLPLSPLPSPPSFFPACPPLRPLLLSPHLFPSSDSAPPASLH